MIQRDRLSIELAWNLIVEFSLLDIHAVAHSTIHKIVGEAIDFGGPSLSPHTQFTVLLRNREFVAMFRNQGL